MNVFGRKSRFIGAGVSTVKEIKGSNFTSKLPIVKKLDH